MDVQAIFGLQFVLSLVVWSVILSFLAVPRLARMDRRDALLWLSLPHAFRHIGLVFMVPGMNARPLESGFAGPAAYGDLATGLLALLAIVALKSRWSVAITLVWIFNVVGSLDLANALRQADNVPRFGASWYIPTMLVPLLLVTHVLMFRRLLIAERETVQDRLAVQ